MQRYQGQTVAFLTQHGKESLVRPVLEPALGCSVQLATGFDTDQLGTFSGEVKRIEGQLQTARTKARLGMQLLGTGLGIASEGAIVPDPFGGLMPWNIELLVWLDDTHQIEVVGMAQGPARSLHRSVRSWPELEKFAHEAGFPEHHLVLRPQSQDDPRTRKGLQGWAELERAFEACQRASHNTLVWAENDHRAYCSPTRQAVIARAASDLLHKLQSACPQCTLPGFAVSGHTPGLPCKLCGQATRLARAYTWRCASCGHHRDEPVPQAHADPGRCDHCNP